ncbi:hypothetical protein J4233_05270 [Candidatus Pacearchaeota archaeon]|nr:hypothetical protein [Candidatus Pacearchaeota archaeon]
MGDVNLVRERRSSVQDGRQVSTLEFLLPNHAIVMAVNGTAKEKYPCPGGSFRRALYTA